jgi:hypothetical protein
MYSFVNDLPEDGLCEPKYGERTLQNNKKLFVFICAVLCLWIDSPQWVSASSLLRIHDHTQTQLTP